MNCRHLSVNYKINFIKVSQWNKHYNIQTNIKLFGWYFEIQKNFIPDTIAKFLLYDSYDYHLYDIMVEIFPLLYYK